MASDIHNAPLVPSARPSDSVVVVEPHHRGAHHPALKHHFDDLGQQHEASTLGMWIFLGTEILFFGGLFLAYSYYRYLFPDAWAEASTHQNWKLGAFNTIVLIVSSLTVAMSVYYAQTNKRRGLSVMLALTILLGATFLVVKAFEYTHHIHDGLFPGQLFNYEGPLAKKVEMFFFLYFTMTAIHALHMVIGIGIYLWLLVRAIKGDFSPQYYGPIEVSGLYWHFVDIVWIFLFPLLYLIHSNAPHP